MNTTASFCGLLGLVAVLASGANVRADDPASTTRVRAQEPELAELVHEGTDRSATFRRLVQRIDETDGIVYIQTGPCSISAVAGCLLMRVTETEHARYLRIHVTAHPTRAEQRISILGHELQHAYEILCRNSVRTTADAYALFIRIGSARSIRGFETDEAQRVEGAIARELAAR